MNPTATELEVLASLVHERVDGALVQRITQPRDAVFLFTLYRAGPGKTRLLIDVTRQAVRFHPTAADLKAPPSSPPLCQLLRKLLGNGRIRGVETLSGDRVAIIHIDHKDGDEVHARRVVCELIPAWPGLYVLDENDVVLAASTAVHGAKRALARGKTWTPPPSPPEQKEDPAPFARFDGWSNDTLFDLLDAEIPDSVGTGIDKRALGKELTKAIKRQFKRVSKVEADVRRTEDGSAMRERGELLKSSLHEIERGTETARVRDWLQEGEVWVEIELDPTLSPQDNVERLFKLAKKHDRGREVAQARLDEQRERLQLLNDFDERLEKASGADLEALAAELAAEGIVAAAPTSSKKKPAAPAPRRPYKTYTSKDGLEILVGRNSRDNDELTFKVARGNEWWLHAQDHAGSHVIIRTDGELPEQTLLDAATLAAIYSKAGNAGKQAVSYTRRKNVSKFKGANPGQVTLKSHKTIVVRMEEERIARLEGKPG